MMKRLSEKYLQKNTPHLSGLRGRGIHVLGTFFYDPEEGSGENNSFYNSSGRKCPPDTVQTHRSIPKDHSQWDSCTCKEDADDAAQICFAKSGYGTDGSKLDAQKGLAESDDNQIADSSCNGRRFVEEDRGDRGWCKDKDQSDQ